MGFGPRESPNPGLLPPCGDRASSTFTSSSRSLCSTREFLAVVNNSSSSIKSRESETSSSLSSTIQGSFRATKSQGLPQKKQQQASSATQHSSTNQSLRTTGVLLAEVSSTGRKSLSSTTSQGRVPVEDLNLAGTAESELTSTIQGSFRATKSQGLVLNESGNSASFSVPLRNTAQLDADCRSTIQGSFKATKSQGLLVKAVDSSGTPSGSQHRCSQSLGERAAPTAAGQ